MEAGAGSSSSAPFVTARVREQQGSNLPSHTPPWKACLPPDPRRRPDRSAPPPLACRTSASARAQTSRTTARHAMSRPCAAPADARARVKERDAAPRHAYASRASCSAAPRGPATPPAAADWEEEKGRRRGRRIGKCQSSVR